eukprot:TRINITY_DN4008_c0_g1_i15.p1 TRINITY_DN4008_c0_g1~~TRINITY_DN4008_c0_g1_i15.p1  ORF type:complete len:543 (-),score=117.81 TRINITY_DN4008_c0_g1_i15:196-1824(-)
MEDSILEADKIILQPVKNQEDPEEDVDDPGPPPEVARDERTSNGVEDQDEPTPEDIEKIKHKCLMTSSEIKGPAIKTPCLKDKPLVMPFKDILQHYFMHYRIEGQWSKLVPPTNHEDRGRIESYQCNICKSRFRANRKEENPEPARSSLIYHLCMQHGKLIDTIREDANLEPEKIESLLNILYKYDSDVRKFIINGADKCSKDELFSINENCEWRIKNMQAPSRVSFNRDKFTCPFNELKDCKEYDNGQALKMHLFQHYRAFWQDTVPQFTKSDAKCTICQKRQTALNPEALRTTMMCHRAIVHNELKDAIKDSIIDFDEELFERLFNPELAAKKLKKLHPSPSGKITFNSFKTYSASSPGPPAVPCIFRSNPSRRNQPTQPDSTSTTKTANNSSVAVKSFYVKKPLPSPKRKLLEQPAKQPKVKEMNKKKAVKTPKNNNNKTSKKRKKTTDFYTDSSENSSDEDVEAAIAPQPYVRKRIKQNLADINFDEDTDEDSDWEDKKQKNGKSSKPSESFNFSARDSGRRASRKTTNYTEDSGDSE